MEELKQALSKVQDKKIIDKTELKDIICKISEISTSLYQSLPPATPLVIQEILYLLMGVSSSLCKILSD